MRFGSFVLLIVLMFAAKAHAQSVVATSQACIGGPSDVEYDSTGDDMIATFNVTIPANSGQCFISVKWYDDTETLVSSTTSFFYVGGTPYTGTTSAAESANVSSDYFYVIVEAGQSGGGATSYDAANWFKADPPGGPGGPGGI